MIKRVSTIAPSEHESVTIRKIANGYLTTRSGCDAKGNYRSSETYSERRPEVSVPTGSTKGAGSKGPASTPLKKAMREVKR